MARLRNRSNPLRETHGAILTAENPLLAGGAIPPKKNAPELPEFDTVGATTEETDAVEEVASKTKTSSVKSSLPERQTHGASFIRGPIHSVQQLIGLRSVAKGSMGSFDNLEGYRKHIEALTLGELHAHAVESQVVPIDDRNRLLTRLEREWTAVASRLPGRGPGINRSLASIEQNQKAQDLLKKMLRR